ncbi:unnamed protein product [Didymodactylos carnosus]|uniref:Uncharacterized protein n=1 Tax=Didymodactylos carnosus TaxID=1234261 RepID=A0A814U8V3_9BILA|nr:unnamed protein product [Didymodactylos carnosus]CAF1496906.1 unnamed protein product [Didymodactylos carnosus]CAF3932520.1 unnamed protein product [Didymodactylos carnosus]CAF4285762.1 unnamed protein product [Didymodactylos carnosus]
MAHYSGSRRPSSLMVPGTQDNFEFELMKLMERDRERVYPNLIQHPGSSQSMTNNGFGNNIPSTNITASKQPPNRKITATPTKTRETPISSIPLPISSPYRPFRIVIIRHAERADAVLGSDWSKKSFDRNGRYIRFSEHLPDALPNRSYLHHYVIDVPLTNRGRMHAFKTGKALFLNGYAADICYVSPSLRCVQSAEGILSGMGRKGVPMQLEPGLFECYLNDFKRTLCFMTKDELAANGYNIDMKYQALMPFMRPHDSQLDYYERCRTIMDTITDRHQMSGGTVLIVAHAPSLEGLTRHLSGGKLQPEKLFDIARRVPFLAMTIVEKNIAEGQWLFRTQPLQVAPTQSMRETIDRIELQAPIPYNQIPSKQLAAQQLPPQPPSVLPPQVSQQMPFGQPLFNQQQQPIPPQPPRIPLRGNSIDTKVTRSLTAPNLRTSHSLSEMFRVI